MDRTEFWAEQPPAVDLIRLCVIFVVVFFPQLIAVIVVEFCILCFSTAVLGVEQSLSRPPGAAPAGPPAVPALVQSPPAQTPQSAP